MLTNCLSPMGLVTNELLSLHEPWQVLIKLACLYNEHALAVEVLDRQVDHPTLEFYFVFLDTVLFPKYFLIKIFTILQL